MCRQFPGRLPSELADEPLLPLLRTVETWQATDAWAAIRAAGRKGESLDDLHGQPMVEEMVGVMADVMREMKAAQAAKRAAQEEQS